MNDILKKLFRKASYFFLWGAPALALAQYSSVGRTPRNLVDLINIFRDIISAFIPLVFTLGLVGFLWGAAKYILAAGDPTKRKEGNMIMLYGIIALFVMISVWGIIKLLQNTFGV